MRFADDRTSGRQRCGGVAPGDAEGKWEIARCEDGDWAEWNQIAAEFDLGDTCHRMEISDLAAARRLLEEARETVQLSPCALDLSAESR